MGVKRFGQPRGWFGDDWLPDVLSKLQCDFLQPALSRPAPSAGAEQDAQASSVPKPSWWMMWDETTQKIDWAFLFFNVRVG